MYYVGDHPNHYATKPTSIVNKISLRCTVNAGLDLNMGQAASSFGSVVANVAPSTAVSGVLSSQLLAFLLMKFLGVKESLFIRGCNRDGEGVIFNTAVQSTKS